MYIKVRIDSPGGGEGAVEMAEPNLDFFYLITHNAPLNTPHHQEPIPGTSLRENVILWTLLDFYLVRDRQPEWPIPKGHNFELKDGDLVIARPRMS